MYKIKITQTTCGNKVLLVFDYLSQIRNYTNNPNPKTLIKQILRCHGHVSLTL